MLGNVLFPASEPCWNSLTKRDLCCEGPMRRFIGPPSAENYVRPNRVHRALSAAVERHPGVAMPISLLALPPGLCGPVQRPLLIKAVSWISGAQVFFKCAAGPKDRVLQILKQIHPQASLRWTHLVFLTLYNCSSHRVLSEPTVDQCWYFQTYLK